MDKLQQLRDRLLKNYTELRVKWMNWPIDMLIDNAHQIAAVKDAYSHLTHEHITEQELDRLLQFQSPLEVVADRWQERMEDTSDFVFAFDAAIRDDDALLCYPLSERAAEPEKSSVLEKLKGTSPTPANSTGHKPMKKQEER